MYSNKFQQYLQTQLHDLEEQGLFKKERIIASPQSAEITLENGKTLLNFCANNYLGLSDNPEVIAASQKMLDNRGYGMSSVRFICGTQDIHKQLEKKIADFLGMEDTILYAAAFDANGGVFEPLFTDEDAIISDELNHASIIDGVRLCKAARYRYKNNNMADLEAQLIAASEKNHRFKIIVTDGVFSMDGIVADLKGVCDLADKYDALVMVDDSHATGFIGKTGRGTHEHNEVMGRVDIITSTLGKALGGAMGGFTSGKKEVIEMLRQKSRPYLFSNSLAPGIVGAALQVLEMLENRATVALYVYTPYQPNEAALAAGSGTGDYCSSYGNRNFYNYFTKWFGNIRDEGVVFEADDYSGTYTIYYYGDKNKTISIGLDNNVEALVKEDKTQWQIEKIEDYYIITNKATGKAAFGKIIA